MLQKCHSDYIFVTGTDLLEGISTIDNSSIRDVVTRIFSIVVVVAVVVIIIIAIATSRYAD